MELFAQVTLVFHLVLADGSVEDVPMGVFEVSEANRLAKCLELKAYDFMLRFDKSFNGFETVGTAYDFIALCCKRCKVEFANKRAEIDAMPNGGVTLSVILKMILKPAGTCCFMWHRFWEVSLLSTGRENWN